jgi:N utilization substance protein A
MMTNKQVEIFEYLEDPDKFLRNALKPAKVKDIRLVDRMDGHKIAMVNVDPKDKGIAIGKNGENIKKIRFLAQRYFQLDTVVIN